MKVEVIRRPTSRRVAGASLAAFIRRVAQAAPRTASSSVTILLTGDDEVRRLNARFRARDATTDVLSFPAGEDALADGTRPLGEIAISVPQAERQAAAAGHSLAREVRLLALHGYLHLLGYDHEVDDGEMMRLQARLVRALLPARSR
ncbi:MAG TPA: rRNA maturation RNase YbeY [Candidatus Polarisedimenticolaceae bacterium]|nr:rRNA maturation RNase YbeY [Candidatus Polarisedimenticolaceae bacterium]